MNDMDTEAGVRVRREGFSRGCPIREAALAQEGAAMTDGGFLQIIGPMRKQKVQCPLIAIPWTGHMRLVNDAFPSPSEK
jgi:hypothetical protein